jgi:hypothetical protein
MSFLGYKETPVCPAFNIMYKSVKHEDAPTFERDEVGCKEL